MAQEPNELRQSAADLFLSLAVAGSQLANIGVGRGSGRLESQGLRAQRDAAHPVMSRTWNREWWDQATPDDVVASWITAAQWANEADPYARVTIEEMRQEIGTRYGAQIPTWPAQPPGEAAALLAPRSFSDSAESEGEYQQTRTLTAEVVIARVPPADFGQTELGITGLLQRPWIPATLNDTIERATVHVLAPFSPEVALARYLSERRAAEPDRYSADVTAFMFYKGEGKGSEITSWKNTSAGFEPQWSGDSHWAHCEVREVEDWVNIARLERNAILNGTTDAGADEVREAALDQLRDAERGDRTYTPEYLRMRAKMAEAQMRGEDPDAVPQAALLGEVDQQQWAGTSHEEIAALFEHVEAWPDGQARTSALAVLRDQVDEPLIRAAIRQRESRRTQEKDPNTGVPRAAEDAEADAAVRTASASFSGTPGQRLTGSLRPAAPAQSQSPKPQATQPPSRDLSAQPDR